MCWCCHSSGVITVSAAAAGSDDGRRHFELPPGSESLLASLPHAGEALISVRYDGTGGQVVKKDGTATKGTAVRGRPYRLSARATPLSRSDREAGLGSIPAKYLHPPTCMNAPAKNWALTLRNHRTSIDSATDGANGDQQQQQEEEETTVCLPHLVYIGCGHSGSTTLLRRLEAHPQLSHNLQGMHAKVGRETWFMTDGWPQSDDVDEAKRRYASLWERGLAEYKGAVVGFEKTPSYWRHKGAADRARKVVPDARLVMMIRDPVDWIHSRWSATGSRRRKTGADGGGRQFIRAKGMPTRDEHGRSLAQEILAGLRVPPIQSEEEQAAAFIHELRNSNFSGYNLCRDLPYGIADWLRAYPREQLLVIFTEDLQNEPLMVMRSIEEHAGLTRHQYSDELLSLQANDHRKKNGQSTHMNKNEEIRTLVKQNCGQYIQAAASILGMPDLPRKLNMA